MNRKQMVKAALFCAALWFVFFIVGMVDGGASARLMLWTIPALMVMARCVGIGKKFSDAVLNAVRERWYKCKAKQEVQRNDVHSILRQEKLFR